jgi:Phage Tail Collar Domain
MSTDSRFRQLGIPVLLAVAFLALESQVHPGISNPEPRGLVAEVARLKQLVCPVGTIVAFGGKLGSEPSGWLACDGKAVKRADYMELWTLIGDAYGGGGTSDEFRLPNLNDRFLLGSVDLRTSGGDWTATTEVAGEHQHGVMEVTGKIIPGQVNAGRWFGDDNPDNQFRNAPDGAHSHKVQIVPPFTRALYIIRAK